MFTTLGHMYDNSTEVFIYLLLHDLKDKNRYLCLLQKWRNKMQKKIDIFAIKLSYLGK